MERDHKLRIGRATYEINSIFSDGLSVSDIVRELIVSKAKQTEN